MAGGGEALGGGPKQKRGKSGKRKAKGRVGFRLDMTPLVDITFLLLTFFMLTTSMITPQTMEMNVPPELEKEIEVRESELVIIRVRADGKMFVNMGNEDPEAPVNLKQLHKFVVDANVDLENRAIVTLKASGEAPYGTVVEILDTDATLGEIEAAVALLQNADEGLIGVKQRHGDRINRILAGDCLRN